MQQDNNKSKEETTENVRGQDAGKQEDPAYKEQVAAAHEAAEQDIEADPDLGTTEDPAADLDEGEIARLDNSNDEIDI
jgi:hypothetical protein